MLLRVPAEEPHMGSLRNAVPGRSSAAVHLAALHVETTCALSHWRLSVCTEAVAAGEWHVEAGKSAEDVRGVAGHLRVAYRMFSPGLSVESA